MKLSVVEWRARKHLAVHIKAYLIHPLHLRLRSCVRSRFGQRSQWKVFTFWGPGSITRAAKSSHSPKVLVECPRRVLHAYEGQCQGQVTKGPYKIKVTNMPCNTGLLGHFSRKYRWQQSFDPMASLFLVLWFNVTFDAGQIKVRPNFLFIFFTQEPHVSC